MKIFSKMRRLGLLPPVPPQLTTSHRLQLDGVTAFTLSVRKEGHEITLCWFRRHLRAKEGDFLIIQRDDGSTTRYRIDAIDTPRDPGDHHFLECTFAPRTPEEKGDEP